MTVNTDSAVKPQPKDICVIGAGPSGLAVLKVILDHPLFKSGTWKPTAFEARDAIGGVWLPGPASKEPPDTPLYDSLTTNLPHPIMGYPSFSFPPSTQLYPPASTIITYLRDYAAHFDLAKYVQLNTAVQSVNWAPDEKKWKVQVRKCPSPDQASQGSVSTHDFDLVIVANGHYKLPRYPSTPGLQTWLNSGRASHSIHYRNPSDSRYSGDTILVIGAGPSGTDISTELRREANKNVILSIAGFGKEDLDGGKFKIRDRVKIFMSHGDVIFDDGTKETGIDHVIVATGYSYSFPFLEPPLSNVISHLSLPPSKIPPVPSSLYNSTYHLFPLAKHIFPLVDTFPPSSLAFVGLSFRTIPFPLFEVQTRAVLKVFEDPSSLDVQAETADIISHYESLHKSLPDPTDLAIAQAWLLLDGPAQFDYRDALHQFVGGEFAEEKWKVPKWVREIELRKWELREKWKESERKGESGQWYRGVGEKGGEEGLEEWVDVMRRLLDS